MTPPVPRPSSPVASTADTPPPETARRLWNCRSSTRSVRRCAGSRRRSSVSSPPRPRLRSESVVRPDSSAREHYEAQVVGADADKDATVLAIEVGFHSEYPKAIENDAVIAHLLANEKRWRRAVGNEAKVGDFLGMCRPVATRLRDLGRSRSERRRPGDRARDPPHRLHHCAGTRTPKPPEVDVRRPPVRLSRRAG